MNDNHQKLSAHRKRRKHNHRKQWIWFFGFIVGFLFLIGGLYLRSAQVRQAAFAAEGERKLPPVKTQPVTMVDTWRTIPFLARLEGERMIEIRATVGGWVQSRKAIRGQSVRQGEILLVLHDERKKLAWEESKARLQSARSQFKEIELRYERTSRLVSEGILSQDQLDTLTNQLQGQRANVDALDAAFRRTEWDMEHMKIRAPISGRVVEIIPDPGQEVLVDQIVAGMVSTEKKRVVAGIDLRWARQIRPGDVVDLVSTVDGTAETAKARVVGISPNMDRVSGTYELEAEIIENQDWWPGEVVTMLIPVEQLKKVIRVPRTAVLSDDSGTFLFVYKNGKVIQVPVTITWLNDSEGAVPFQSIPDESEIVIEGHVGLANGQAVRVLQ